MNECCSMTARERETMGMAGDRLAPCQFGTDLGAEGFCHWALVGITDTYCAEGTSSCRHVGRYGKGCRIGALWLVACRVFVRTLFGLDGMILLRYTYYDANPKDDAVWSSPSPATTGTTPADRLRNHCLPSHKGHISAQRKQNTECIDCSARVSYFWYISDLGCGHCVVWKEGLATD